MQTALTHETDQRLAIDTGDPLALWPIDDLIAERHRLHQVLAECPDDRRHDVTSLTERRAQIADQVEPLVYRYNELADRRLRGPGTRSEMRELLDKITERSTRLDRIDQELHGAERDVRDRTRFQIKHAPDSGRLDAVRSELDRHIAHRVDRHMADPSDNHLRILGAVLADSDHQAIWKRGAAAILETHHIGADPDPTRAGRSSLLGSQRETAETRARLEVAAIPRHRDPPGLDPDVDIGLDLFD